MTKINQVVLIEPKTSGINFFSLTKMPLLGLPILGTVLKKMELKVKIFCENLAPINWKEVYGADLVGISVLTNLANRAYEIVDKVKAITKDQVPVVMGGPHVTFLPEEALDKGADFVVRHEGEKTLEMLVKYLQGKGSKTLEQIPGLSYRKGEEIKHNPDQPLLTGKDLNENPPNFSLIKGSERINSVPIQTSRGCPHHCKFCTVTQMFGRKIRHRNPENVVQEIKKIKPGIHVFIVDDNFSANLNRTRALLELMREEGINRDWSTQERVSVAWKKEILKLMRETGCTRLYQGLESFNPEALKELKKEQTPEEIEEAIRILHNRGFLIHGMFILGTDTDTPSSINQTINCAIRYGIDTVQFFPLVPAVDTEIYQKFKKAGRIIDWNWEHYDGQYVVFQPNQMSPWKLQKLTIKGYQKFYTLWRGIKWAIKGKGGNSYFAFYGSRGIKKWIWNNKKFLENLKSK